MSQEIGGLAGSWQLLLHMRHGGHLESMTQTPDPTPSINAYLLQEQSLQNFILIQFETMEL